MSQHSLFLPYVKDNDRKNVILHGECLYALKINNIINRNCVHVGLCGYRVSTQWMLVRLASVTRS